VVHPVIYFVQGPTPEQSQEGVDSSWVDVVDKWIPIKLNKVSIRNGEIHYRDFNSNPKIDIYLDKLEAEALNLSNTNKSNELLPSTVTAHSNAYGDGTFDLKMKLNALAKQPTFDLNAELKDVNLVKLNDFLKAYAKIDVKRGKFGLYTEIASKDGAYKGYIKPLISDLDVLQLNKEEGNVLQIAWEAVVAGVGEILENKPNDRIASKIPISGNYKTSQIDIWTTVGSLLKNAFISALKPSIDQSISINNVGGGTSSGFGSGEEKKETRKERKARKKAEEEKEEKKRK
jgi:hypothetical protein